ncbi:hypothetical protein [Streptomyces sp. SD31]|uniref:hypothetical protein n=1 Tax=Streptomyces sp. SD31 TaxID=3452208 RepID=UPI003F8C60B5
MGRVTERALVHDIAATYAVPLHRRRQLLGALNVFVPGLPAEGDDGTALRLARIVADCAALGLRNNTSYVQ